MAISQNPITGHMRQSLGNATFTTWMGLNVVKSKAISVANPRTEGQVNQRERMKAITSIGKKATSVLDRGFKKQALKMTTSNAFTSKNLKNGAISVSGGSATIDYSLIEFTGGNLPRLVRDPTGTTYGVDNVKINFPTSFTAPNNQAIAVYAVVYNETQDELFATNVGRAVSTGSVTVSMPTQAVSGDVIHSYLYYVNPVTKESSVCDYEQGTV
jgi:hypothetical protein